MVISSLIVNTSSEYTQTVSEKLKDVEGVEVHEIQGYKIVITIEAQSIDASHKIASSLSDITGVLTVNLVYANFEDDPEISARRIDIP